MRILKSQNDSHLILYNQKIKLIRNDNNVFVTLDTMNHKKPMSVENLIDLRISDGIKSYTSLIDHKNNNKPNNNSEPIINEETYNHNYSFPKEGMFVYIACPHYLAEIGIYFSFYILAPMKISMIMMLLWVICNLAIVADIQHKWYEKHFPEEFYESLENENDCIVVKSTDNNNATTFSADNSINSLSETAKTSRNHIDSMHMDINTSNVFDESKKKYCSGKVKSIVKTRKNIRWKRLFPGIW